MNTPECPPVLFYPSEEFLKKLQSLSGRAVRVLFGSLALLDGNHITATQKQIGKYLKLHETGVSRAFSELREVGLLFEVQRGVYTVLNQYFRRENVPKQQGF